MSSRWNLMEKGGIREKCCQLEKVVRRLFKSQNAWMEGFIRLVSLEGTWYYHREADVFIPMVQNYLEESYLADMKPENGTIRVKSRDIYWDYLNEEEALKILPNLISLNLQRAGGGPGLSEVCRENLIFLKDGKVYDGPNKCVRLLQDGEKAVVLQTCHVEEEYKRTEKISWYYDIYFWAKAGIIPSVLSNVKECWNTTQFLIDNFNNIDFTDFILLGKEDKTVSENKPVVESAVKPKEMAEPITKSEGAVREGGETPAFTKAEPAEEAKEPISGKGGEATDSEKEESAKEEQPEDAFKGMAIERAEEIPVPVEEAAEVPVEAAIEKTEESSAAAKEEQPQEALTWKNAERSEEISAPVKEEPAEASAEAVIEGSEENSAPAKEEQPEDAFKETVIERAEEIPVPVKEEPAEASVEVVIERREETSAVAKEEQPKEAFEEAVLERTEDISAPVEEEPAEASVEEAIERTEENFAAAKEEQPEEMFKEEVAEGSEEIPAPVKEEPAEASVEAVIERTEETFVAAKEEQPKEAFEEAVLERTEDISAPVKEEPAEASVEAVIERTEENFAAAKEEQPEEMFKEEVAEGSEEIPAPVKEEPAEASVEAVIERVEETSAAAKEEQPKEAFEEAVLERTEDISAPVKEEPAEASVEAVIERTEETSVAAKEEQPKEAFDETVLERTEDISAPVKEEPAETSVEAVIDRTEEISAAAKEEQTEDVFKEAAGEGREEIPAPVKEEPAEAPVEAAIERMEGTSAFAKEEQPEEAAEKLVYEEVKDIQRPVKSEAAAKPVFAETGQEASAEEELIVEAEAKAGQPPVMADTVEAEIPAKTENQEPQKQAGHYEGAEDMDFVERNGKMCIDEDRIQELLDCDKNRCRLEPYDKDILFDIIRGHWELFDEKEGTDLKEAGTDGKDEGRDLIARDPKLDIKQGVIGIDFGTKSTVVVRQDATNRIIPIRIGTGNLSSEVKEEDFENPSIIEFTDMKKFMEDYRKEAGRPHTSCNDVFVSYDAYEDFRNCKPEDFYAYFSELKQWANREKGSIIIKDKQGEEYCLSEKMDAAGREANPIELYAYYIGLYINNMRNGIYLNYLMSFPVGYSKEIRDFIAKSFYNGIKKSFPESILNDRECMEQFKVELGISEPAAYAVTALEQNHLEPEEETERLMYGIFDFGGGTTDFDFGICRGATEEEYEKDAYDYVLECFGADSDVTLGGENILELLAYHVYQKNIDVFREKKITFTLPLGENSFAGSETLLINSQIARRNMAILKEELRPLWYQESGWRKKYQLDNESQNEADKEGVVVSLYNMDGEPVPQCILEFSSQDMVELLKDRIQKGIDSFFQCLIKLFLDKKSKNKEAEEEETVYIFLAGNSSKSVFVKELFQRKIEEYYGKSQKLDEGMANIHFELIDPLTGENENGDPYQPNAKTGVAYGLLKSRDGSSVKIVKNYETDSLQQSRFRYYLGRDRRHYFDCKFSPKEITYKKWIPFQGASKKVIRIYYTNNPLADSKMEKMPIENVPYKEISIDVRDDAYLFIRTVEPNMIEYAVAKEVEEISDNDIKRCNFN